LVEFNFKLQILQLSCAVNIGIERLLTAKKIIAQMSLYWSPLQLPQVIVHYQLQLHTYI